MHKFSEAWTPYWLHLRASWQIIRHFFLLKSKSKQRNEMMNKTTKYLFWYTKENPYLPPYFDNGIYFCLLLSYSGRMNANASLIINQRTFTLELPRVGRNAGMTRKSRNKFRIPKYWEIQHFASLHVPSGIPPSTVICAFTCETFRPLRKPRSPKRVRNIDKRESIHNLKNM